MGDQQHPVLYYSSRGSDACIKMIGVLQQWPPIARAIEMVDVTQVGRNSLPSDLRSVPAIKFRGTLFSGTDAFTWMDKQITEYRKQLEQARQIAEARKIQQIQAQQAQMSQMYPSQQQGPPQGGGGGFQPMMPGQGMPQPQQMFQAPGAPGGPPPGTPPVMEQDSRGPAACNDGSCDGADFNIVLSSPGGMSSPMKIQDEVRSRTGEYASIQDSTAQPDSMKQYQNSMQKQQQYASMLSNQAGMQQQQMMMMMNQAAAMAPGGMGGPMGQPPMMPNGAMMMPQMTHGSAGMPMQEIQRPDFLQARDTRDGVKVDPRQLEIAAQERGMVQANYQQPSNMQWQSQRVQQQGIPTQYMNQYAEGRSSDMYNINRPAQNPQIQLSMDGHYAPVTAQQYNANAF